MNPTDILREALNASSMTLKEIGELSGCDPSNLKKFRDGMVGIGLNRGVKLAEILGVALKTGPGIAESSGPKIRTLKSVAPVDLMPSDDGPEPRFPVKVTKVDNRPVLKPVEDIPVGFDPRPSTPSPKPRFSAAEINRRKKLGMPTD